jgi:hypothetical protein
MSFAIRGGGTYASIRRVLSLALLVPLLALSVAFQGRPTPPPKPEDQIVYVTKTGAAYHVSTCRYLKTSKIPIRLGDAVKKFRPCSVCKPPTLKTQD